MGGSKLLEKLEQDSATLLFEKLYGQEGAEAGKKRYAALIENMLNSNCFPPTDFPEAAGGLRLVTAAGRTELGGNHTDHNRGRVVAAAVQLDQAAVAAPRTDSRIFFRSTGYPDLIVDLVDKDGNPDIKPKENEKGTTHALIRGITAEFITRGAAVKGITVNADSTVLPGSGLSSSAAVETLFGRIINNLYNEGKCSSLEIAQIGQKAENLYFGKPCGLMDQIASAYGGAAAIDFAGSIPVVKQLDVDFTAAGLALCVINTGGSHADLTEDYAAIPAEMKAVAAFFGKETLRECEKEAVEKNSAGIRQKLGDRALLRAFHFFDENQRAMEMPVLLEKLSYCIKQGSNHSREIADYLRLVNESGDSSWKLLQNVYSAQNVQEQGIALGLALTKNFLKGNGACRIHGGGFAGTIQAYIPIPALENYRSVMDNVFGAGSVTVLRIRPIGAEELML
jgi:galactokinase